MKTSTFLKSTLALCITILLASLAGCGENQQQVTLQDENQRLADRVAELEYALERQHAEQQQMRQTQTPATGQAFTPTQPTGPALGNTSVYLVVQGDTLYSIARKQLGSGQRYKEILALNPHVAENKPLPIGTKLTLPPK